MRKKFSLVTITLSALVLALTIAPSSRAQMPLECRFARHWINCQDYWEKKGLTEERLKLAVALAQDAYFPYAQASQGLTPDLTQPIQVEGEKPYLTKLNYKPSSPHTPLNFKIFYGVTGTYGLRTTTPLGFVYFRPSGLEKALLAHPELLHKYSLKELAEAHSTRSLIVVAFRGTVGWQDLLTDGSSRMMPAPGPNGNSLEFGFFERLFANKPEVHGGVLSALQSAIPAIHESVLEFKYDRRQDLSLDRDPEVWEEVLQNTQVMTAGHSLGGALAQIYGLAAAQKPEFGSGQTFSRITNIVFNSPMVGNEAHARYTKAQGADTFEIIRKTDFIPKLPGIIPNPILQNYVHGADQLLLSETEDYHERGYLERIGDQHSIDRVADHLNLHLNDTTSAVREFIEDLADEEEWVQIKKEEEAKNLEKSAYEAQVGLQNQGNPSWWQKVKGFFRWN